MAEIHYIKHLREKEGLSIHAISQKLGINWRTAKKYADGDVPYRTISVKKGGMMYEEKFGDIVDVWLEEDTREKPKYRRTNKKMYEQLVTHHGFKGSYRTVCAYIQERKPSLAHEERERFERLVHPPGEAQVDFGKMRVVEKDQGGLREISTLIMSFPYSNAAYSYPLPAENQECFLTGLQELFKQVGGVPKILRIDNLSAAVVSIGRGGQRTYTEGFLAFQAHYGFEVQACQPGKGNEKGNVEKKVGYLRKHLFVPEPLMESFSQLADWMQEKLFQDRQRLHYEKGVLIETLWQEERTNLHPLSNERPIHRIDQAVVNKYGEVRIDGHWMLVPGARPRQTVTLQKTWERVTFYTGRGDLLHQALRPYMHSTKEWPWEEILVHWKKKPRAVQYSRYFPILPTEVQLYLTETPSQTQTRVHRLLSLYRAGHGWTEVATLFQSPGRTSATTDELLALLDARRTSLPEPFEETHTPSILYSIETDLAPYDALLGVRRNDG